MAVQSMESFKKFLQTPGSEAHEDGGFAWSNEGITIFPLLAITLYNLPWIC